MKTRIIHTKFWTDGYVRNLNVKETLFFLWLILNEYIDVLGIIEVSDDIITRQTHLTVKEIETVKKKLHDDGKIDCYKNYIYVTNAYKFQTYTGIKNVHPKLRTIFEMSDDVQKHYSGIIKFWLGEIKEDIEPYKDNQKYSKVISLYERVCKRFEYALNTPIDTPIYTPMDRGQNTEYRIQNTEIRIQNTEIRKGLYDLTQEDFKDIANSLQVKIPEVEKCYDELKDYCASRGKTYKDYKATLRGWVRRKIEDGKIKQNPNQKPSNDPLVEASRRRNL